MTWMVLIPLCPMAASLVIALGGRQLGKQSHRIAIGAVATSFVLAVLGSVYVVTGGPIAVPLYTLLSAGSLTIDLGLYADGFAMALLLLVSGIGSIVHIFSSRYMQGDPRYQRFFAVMSLFTSAMLLLVLSANLLMLYMSWEIMGICSYLLISHWSERRSATQAATKAFLVNAVADAGLGFGIVLTWATFQTLDIRTILSRAPEVASHMMHPLSVVGLDWSVPVLFVLSCLLFVGPIGKSAQFPLHVWLPFAMEAPTPVSALIHAATMVNAGVYLLIRLGPLYELSPGAMLLVAVVGGVTALFAGIVGLTQCDIKRILAYSTISQLGFMVLACGAGAYRAATFHLVSHGALKAYLFLSTGSAVTAAAPVEHRHAATTKGGIDSGVWPLYTVSLLLALLPVLILFSEPYRMLWLSTDHGIAGSLYSILAWTTTFFAAYYVTSLIFEIFSKPSPSVWRRALPAQLLRPRILSVSLTFVFLLFTAAFVCILALLWAAFTFVLIPISVSESPFTNSSTSVFISLEHLSVPLALAVFGWALAIFARRSIVPRPAWLTEVRARLYVFFMNHGYIDEAYDHFVVNPTIRTARWVWRCVDIRVVDQAYRWVATSSLMLSRFLWQMIDVRGIDRGVTGFGYGSLTLAQWLWQMIDVRGIDRAVNDLGTSSLTTARWLWNVDVRGIEWTADEVGRQSDATGRRLARMEPRTLQHHILLMIVWLILGLAVFYWFVR